MDKQLTVPAELQLRSQQLLQLIKQQLEIKGGAISFAEFMQLALYAPGLGYYSGGLTKFGEQGDFITAPELSPLFGYCLAQQCRQILEHTAGAVLEFGAGSGKLALTILSCLAEEQALPQHYYILEPSAELQQRQRQLFLTQAPELLSRVTWLERLPANFSGVILANEVLDAMPVHLFSYEQGKFYQKYVTWQENSLTWLPKSLAPESPLAQRVISLHDQFGQNWQEYSSEVSLMIPAWLSSLANCLTKGVALLIDYGFLNHEYYHPQRSMGTLMCHYRHHAHANPLWHPGIQDITAHVDFSLVGESAEQAGLEVLGYTNQTNFLLQTGIDRGFAKYASDTASQFSLAQQIKILTLPHEMGELFKVMALGKNYTADLQGFSR